MDECAYVYILASKYKRLYTGVTSTLETRVWQHKNKVNPESFTAKYNIDQLVYFERFGSISAAIAREKEIKGWLRVKKVALIVAINPSWRDLSEEWGKPVDPLMSRRCGLQQALVAETGIQRSFAPLRMTLGRDG